MKYKTKDIGFCTFFYSVNDSSILKEISLLKKAYLINKKALKIDIPKFSVKFAYSRKQLDRLWGSKTPDYVCAFVNDDEKDKIIILSYSIFNKESIWKKKDFLGTLIHEVNHLFYTKLRNHPYKPLWLCEGLASFFQMKQTKKKVLKIKITKKVLMQNSFKKMDGDSYEIFASFVNFLIKKYKMKNILELMKG
jgi:hypothetical protein